ncbi:P-loop containing nucleoside triphosphate hydrolase protein, partial [Entophlyctis helioformis]
MALPPLKVMLLGDSGVGKTRLVACFLHSPLSPSSPPHDAPYKPTAGIDFHSTIFSIDAASLPVKFQLLDAAGQLPAQAVSPYCKVASAAIIVYSTSSRSSFESIPSWTSAFLKTNTACEPAVMVIGTLDDNSRTRQVSKEEGQQFAASHGFLFVETSALDHANVNNAF